MQKKSAKLIAVPWSGERPREVGATTSLSEEIFDSGSAGAA